jgi:predicted DsbA family dithiol-disulfide isomerase
MRVLLGAVPAFVLALAPSNVVAADTPANEPAGGGTSVAFVGNQTITAEELDEQMGNRLFRLRSDEYNLRRPVLDELVSRSLLEQEAAKRHVTVDNLIASEVDAKAKPVQDEEVEAVYESAKQNYANVPEAEARKQIADGMRRSRAQRRRQAFAAELRTRYSVKVLLEAPRATFKLDDAPSRGPADAPVTLVGFLDFQCPYCANVGRTVDDLQKRYGKSVRFVFRHFPLPFHKEAAKAAEAAICAQQQGKFWEIHDKLFSSQRALQAADLKKYAGEIGLDPDAFGQCLDSGRTAEKWRADVQEGSQFGVTGTPTLFVNGRLLSAGANPEALSQAVDQELASMPPATAAAAKKR